MKIKIQELDVPNKNGRVYPTKTIEEALQNLSWPVPGTLGLCESTYVDMSKVAFIVDELHIEDGYLVGEMTMLPIPANYLSSLPPDYMAYRLSGTGNVDDNGVVTDYSIAYIAAIPAKDAA